MPKPPGLRPEALRRADNHRAVREKFIESLEREMLRAIRRMPPCLYAPSPSGRGLGGGSGRAGYVAQTPTLTIPEERGQEKILRRE